ncbi:hypothetical protein [Sporosarcina koreensis]|uniref:hypothetical protein n=1 Tax=Sporosarcina koreensis TaxID=334735 RepID=UPI000756B520|nr:hypothetical protein [Sporosarcina koreensis]
MKYLKLLVFTGSFIVSFILISNHALANNFYGFCNVSSSLATFCNANGSASDHYTTFDITHSDSVRKVDPYNLHLSYNTISGTMKKGAPMLQDFIVYDNKNAKYYTYSARNGKILQDVSPHSISVARQLGYYPSGYERPVTLQKFRSGNALDCASSAGFLCQDYTIGIQYDLK